MSCAVGGGGAFEQEDGEQKGDEEQCTHAGGHPPFGHAAVEQDGPGILDHTRRENERATQPGDEHLEDAPAF